MGFYLIILILLIGLGVGLIIWVYRLFRLIGKGKKKSFMLQSILLSTLVIITTWGLQIFPFSKNFYIKKQTTQLTGKTFWCWKEYTHDEWGIRGEGYSLYIYKFNQEMANYFSSPDSSFFNEYPLQADSDIRWTPTPVKTEDMEILEFATPIYAGWEGEIVDQQDSIRKIANSKGSYYAYKEGGSTDFYLISPKDRLVILINHDM